MFHFIFAVPPDSNGTSRFPDRRSPRPKEALHALHVVRGGYHGGSHGGSHGEKNALISSISEKEDFPPPFQPRRQPCSIKPSAAS